MSSNFDKALEALATNESFCTEATELSQFKGFDADRYKFGIQGDDGDKTLKIAVAGAMLGSNWKKQSVEVRKHLSDLAYVEDWTTDKASAKTILRTTNVLANYVVAVTSKNESLLQERWSGNKQAFPKCLQFPGAAALDMGPNCREAHIAFCTHFSGLLGGTFNKEIYDAMSRNKLQAIKGTAKTVINYLSK